MLVCPDGVTVGSLSGGCLEEEVARRAFEVMGTGTPSLMSFDTRLRFGCNGSIEVFVEAVPDGFLAELAAHFTARRICRALTRFEGKEAELGTRLLALDEQVPGGAFLQEIEPPIQLVIFGEGPDSIPLRAFAEILGWDVIEVDQAAALPSRLDARTAAIVKSHNYGRDFAALRHLLALDLPYVGLLGPRKRRDQLLNAVLDSGISIDAEIFAPAGLDLGAETPEEIALALISEIQAVFAERAPNHCAIAKRRSTDGTSCASQCRRRSKHVQRRRHNPRRRRIGAVRPAKTTSRLSGRKPGASRTVRAATEAMLAAGVVVVAGESRAPIEDELRQTSAAVVQNPDWRRGLGTSIRCGLQHLIALRPDLDAVVLMACDQPFVDGSTIAALIAEQERSGKAYCRLQLCGYSRHSRALRSLLLRGAPGASGRFRRESAHRIAA